MSDLVEEWREVSGWPRYEVSDWGRVRRKRGRGRHETRELKGKRGGKTGRYVHLTLSDRKNTRYVPLHRLVLEAFWGPAPSSRHEGAHLDGQPENNRATNLQWKLPTDNAFDKWRHGTQPIKHPTERVEIIRFLVAAGLSKRKIARAMGISQTTVTSIALGRTRNNGF